MARLRTRQAEFFASAPGRPIPCTGTAIAGAHRGRGIQEEHGSLAAGHLTGSLETAGVPADLTSQIIAAVAPLRDGIVTRGPAVQPPQGSWRLIS